MPDADVLLIGGGVASLSCAETLRDGGYEGSIVLATRELDAPYDRPPCSKGYLQGRTPKQELYLKDEGWYAANGIDLRTRANVMKLDPAQRTARIGKEDVAFGMALLATGAQVRRLPVDGAELEGSHYLRAPGNADTIRRDVEQAERVVLIGGSYIACEVAASLTALGKQCAMVMLEAAPLATGFGPQVGAWAARLLSSHGIELHCGDGLGRFEGANARLNAVLTAAGTRVPADAVVLGTGAVPDVMLARAAGFELGATGGVRCDASLRTAVPGIWAAGDCAEYESVLHGGPARVEHWEHAAAQGRHVGARMLAGDDEPYAEVPYFWSDLSDWATVEYIGGVRPWSTDEVVAGSLDGDAFTIAYLDADGIVVGALTAGRPDDLAPLQEKIAARERL